MQPGDRRLRDDEWAGPESECTGPRTHGCPNARCPETVGRTILQALQPALGSGDNSLDPLAARCDKAREKVLGMQGIQPGFSQARER